MVGNVENTCIQECSRSSTAANRSWICNPRGRGTEFMHFIPSKSSIPFSWLILLTLLAATGWSRTYDQQRGAIPLSSNYSWCTLLQRITTNKESDNDCSARLTSVGFQAKTNFCALPPESWPRKGRWSWDEWSRNQNQLPQVHQSPTPTW